MALTLLTPYFNILGKGRGEGPLIFALLFMLMFAICGLCFLQEIVCTTSDTRVSIQEVKSLGGHFAYLCRGFAFIVIIFKKENGNTFTLLIIFIVKSLQKVIQLHGH